jgi:tetratricopeptide (TPR) repeat protein
VKQGAEEGAGVIRGHSAASILGIVASILEGEILRANGNVQEAVEILEKGVELEDGLVYDEPEPLNFSVRHWLGDALLEAGENARAAEVYRAELKDHPHNGWSLFGLERALRAQGKDQEADQVHAEFEVSWARADVYIRSSIF